MKRTRDADHLQPVTAAFLCRTTGLEKEARGLAVVGQPKAEHTGLTKSESDVREIIAERIAKRHGELSDAEHGLRSEVTQLLSSARRMEADALPGVVTTRIMSTFQTLQPVIRETVAAERQGRAEFQAFVHKNGLLERSAQYPESKIKHFGGVVLITLVESAANAVMYVEGSTAGWMGAGLTAGAVAVGNVGLAVLAGLAFRYIGLETQDHD